MTTETIPRSAEDTATEKSPPKRKSLALVASKGGLDEVYPVLIMATTAAALDWDVRIFCTFYGLDIVNPKRNKKLKVSAVGNAASPPPFSSGPEFRVPTILGILPGMNIVATKMMKSWMKKSNIPDFQTMMDICLEGGVQFYACATTMGVMNVKMEDVMPEASCLGATAFLDFAAEADIALFI
jgi:peroxiredoxin family protein